MRFTAILIFIALLAGYGWTQSAPTSPVHPVVEITSLVESEDMLVVVVEVQHAENRRMVVLDARNGSTRDSLLLQGGTGRITIVASLLRTPDLSNDMLHWVVGLTTSGASVVGPSQVPVPEGASLDHLVEVLLDPNDVSPNKPTPLLRIQSRTLDLALR